MTVGFSNSFQSVIAVMSASKIGCSKILLLRKVTSSNICDSYSSFRLKPILSNATSGSLLLDYYLFCLHICSTLRLQKRLAAAVLKCGRNKVWLDPNETNEIANANSSKIILFHIYTIIIIKC